MGDKTLSSFTGISSAIVRQYPTRGIISLIQGIFTTATTLNDAGIPIRTMRLIEDSYRAENIYEAVGLYADIPNLPHQTKAKDLI